MKTSKLTAEQQNMINQVAATMAISDMPLTEENIKELEDIVTGKITIEESIEQMKQKYAKKKHNHE